MKKVKKGEKLQAVIVCENFTGRDQNFDLQSALLNDDFSALGLRVGGQLVIEIIVKELYLAGVQEIFLCSSVSLNADLLSQLQKIYSKHVSLVPIQSSKFQSIGDIIRDLDFKSKIEDHFFLVHSDVVSNVNLKAALQKHKQLYKQSKLNSLTAVLNNNLSPDNPIVSTSNQFKAMFLPDSERLVWYSNDNSASKMYLDVDILTQHGRLDVMTNLYETGIWVCAPEVAHLFVDNFDFQDMSQFIRGILDNEEIMGSTVHAHFVPPHELSSRCLQSWHQFNFVNSMVTQRMFYPLVPDRVHPEMEFSPHASYVHQTSRFNWDSVYLDQTQVWDQTSIGLNCKLEFSVLSSNCSIGNNVLLRRCYLDSDVTIEDNCELEGAFIAKGARVKKQSVLKNGFSILGCNVVLGPGAVLDLRGAMFLQSLKHLDDSSECSENKKLGTDATGFFIISKVPETGDKGQETQSSYLYQDLTNGIKLYNGEVKRVKVPGTDTLLSESDYSFSQSEDELRDEFTQMAVTDDHDIFVSEVQDSIERNVTENSSIEDLILEINSSKFAYNASLSDVVRCITESVVNLKNVFDPVSNDRKSWFAKAQRNLNQLKKLFLHYLADEENQKTAVLTLERILNERPPLIAISPNFMLFLYQNDFVSETAFLDWSTSEPYECFDITETNPTTEQDTAAKKIDKMTTRTKCKEFIEFMNRSDDEDEDDD